MKNPHSVIQLLVIALNAVFIGAIILIAIVLVPYWQSSEPQLFLDWFSTYGPILGIYLGPIVPITFILAVIALLTTDKNKILWGLTATFLLANNLYLFIYYLPVNLSFAQQTIDLSNISNELLKWQSYHRHRIFFTIAALITSMLAVIKK